MRGQLKNNTDEYADCGNRVLFVRYGGKVITTAQICKSRCEKRDK